MNGITHLTPSDLPEYKEFIRTHFHDRYIFLDDAFFDWQYLQNPFNPYSSYAMKIIHYKNTIAGYCGIVPVDLQVGNNVIGAGVLANLLITPTLRGFGFGVYLLKEIAKDFPVCYVNGYSADIQPIYERMIGWTEMGNLHRYVAVLNDKKIAALSKSRKIFPSLSRQARTSLTLQRISQFGRQIEEFWDTIRPRYGITVVRSSTYLNWRYAHHPILKYHLFIHNIKKRVDAFVVIRIEEFTFQEVPYKVARIIDFMSETSVEKEVLQAVIAECQGQDCDLIDYFFSGSVHTLALAELGFVQTTNTPYTKIPMLFNPVNYERFAINWAAYSDSSVVDNDRFSNPDHWYVTKGDGDQDRPNRV